MLLYLYDPPFFVALAAFSVSVIFHFLDYLISFSFHFTFSLNSFLSVMEINRTLIVDFVEVIKTDLLMKKFTLPALGS